MCVKVLIGLLQSGNEYLGCIKDEHFLDLIDWHLGLNKYGRSERHS
jgi:hypothetical protein